MNLTLKLDNTTITVSASLNRELVVDIDISKEDAQEVLRCIYEKLSMEDFISTLDISQIHSVSEYGKEVL